MAKVMLPLLFLLAFLHSNGQIKDAQLSQIKTIDQAKAFVKKSSNADTKVFTIHAKEDTSDIFMVDTPEQKWYHVVLKTHDNTWLKDVTLLQVRSGN
jgi:hypothetical protein